MDVRKALWRKSSYSEPNGGDCVEVAGVAGIVAIRDSKHPTGLKLLVGRDAFSRLADHIKSDRGIEERWT
ncbi:DUF397 domain-containing protein [Spirillospora sp. NPDC127200]